VKMKRIKKENTREDKAKRVKQEKIKNALNNNRVGKHGLTPEQLRKANSNSPSVSPEKVLSVRSIKGGKQKNRRPARVARSRIANKATLSEVNPQPREWAVPDWFRNDTPVDVSIIVPLYKSQDVIKGQIETWDLDKDGITKEIIYCDDNCPNKSHLAVLKCWEKRKKELKHPIGKIIVNSNNGGYGPNCNIGAKHAKGKYLIFLNADCRLTKNWIKPLVDRIKTDSKIGIVGNLQLSHDGKTIDSAGSEWNWKTNSFQHIGKHIYNGSTIKMPFRTDKAPKDIFVACEREMVTGCCFIIPKKLFNDIGGYDEEYRIGYWEDSEMNLTVRAEGYKIFYEPKSRIMHHSGHAGAGGHKFMHHNKMLFRKRWIDNGRINEMVSMQRQDNKLSVTLETRIKDKVVGCVIACNEEEFLEASIDSVSSIVDEWVFVIGGNEYAYKSGMCDSKGIPNDSTLEIAKKLSNKYGGTVIEPPGRLWKDKVEMRNAYVPHLKAGDWMFMVDGDEVYKPRQLWKIAELMDSNEVLIMQFHLFWNNVNTIGTGSWERYPQERVVKWKKGYGYRGRNHLFVTNEKKELVHTVRPCWKGSEKLFYHYSWIRPTEKIEQKREYYKYQSGNKHDTYVEKIFLKWRDDPKSISHTHPMGGGGYERFNGIHPIQVQALIKEGKLNF